MKIIVDYLEEKRNVNYHSDICAAISACQGDIAIKEVDFINFPITEVDIVLSLIRETVEMGVVTILKGVIIFIKSKEPFSFVISDPR